MKEILSYKNVFIWLFVALIVGLFFIFAILDTSCGGGVAISFAVCFSPAFIYGAVFVIFWLSVFLPVLVAYLVRKFRNKDKEKIVT